VTAAGTMNAREPAVRVAAFEKAPDDPLFDQALQPSLGPQLHRVPLGALVERTRARIARAIEPAAG